MAETATNSFQISTPREEIWRDGIGNGFNAGTFQTGFSVGAGIGWATFGSREAHDLALASINFGWMMGGVKARDHWFSGNWEIAGELFGGAQFNPDVRYLIGFTPLLRYNFATATRWVPFLNAGGGVAATDIGHPDLGSTFEFDPQAGVGMHYFLRKDLAITVDYRWLHLSNAGIHPPNHGLNTQMFSIGLNWFF